MKSVYLVNEYTGNKFHDGITKHLSTVFSCKMSYTNLNTRTIKQLPVAISQQFTVVLWSHKKHLANSYKCSLS